MIKGMYRIGENIDLQKEGDKSYIFLCDKNYSADSLIKELDNHLAEVILTLLDINEHNQLLKDGYTKQSLLDYSKEFLKKVKLEKGDYPYKNAGELGEVFLSVFQKEILGALKVVSKIRHRDSITFNVLGRDATYVYKDEKNQVCMLIGEAKLYVNSKRDGKIVHASLKNGLSDAHDDLKDYHENKSYINHEINLARSSMKEEMTDANKELYIQYFIKDNPKHSELVYKNIIFVGYSFQSYKEYNNGDLTEREFLDEVILNMNDTFSSKAIKGRVERITTNNIYILVPFLCVEELRAIFVEYNNLKDE